MFDTLCFQILVLSQYQQNKKQNKTKWTNQQYPKLINQNKQIKQANKQMIKNNPADLPN